MSSGGPAIGHQPQRDGLRLRVLFADGARGHLFARIRVRVPEKLCRGEKKVYERLQSLSVKSAEYYRTKDLAGAAPEQSWISDASLDVIVTLP